MMKAISLQELKKLKQEVYETIEIPGFNDQSAIPVDVKKVSLMDLSECKILPNSLLMSVNAIFVRQQKGPAPSEKELAAWEQQLREFTEIVYKEALIQPTFKDFEEAGLPLTSIQKRMIAEYAIGDVSTLNRFRKFREGLKNNSSSEGVQQKTQRDNGNK